MHKELEVLSVQHTQTCLENSQLSQELQNERKSSTQYQKENQELKHKQVLIILYFLKGYSDDEAEYSLFVLT